MIKNCENLKDLAAKSLEACFVDDKLVASPAHFSDYWARDTFWALPGMLQLHHYDRAKKNIELFLSYQREDGKIPRKISQDVNILKYLFDISLKRNQHRPVYTAIIRPFYSMDENALMIRAIEKYLKKTGDKVFIEKNFDNIERAITWYKSCVKQGLVHEYFLANWMDTVLKTGAVLYTNTVYCEALKSFSNIARALKRIDLAEKYTLKYRRTKDAINQQFWNGEFYLDSINGFFSQFHRKQFDVAGNVLACYLGIADEQQTQYVLKKLNAYTDQSAFVRAVYPRYPFWKINPLVFIMGIRDYHDGASWLWLNLLSIAVEYQSGSQEKAGEKLDEIAKCMEGQGEIGETYFLNGKTYKKMLWKSASPFAWSSGIVLEVLAMMDTQEGV